MGFAAWWLNLDSAAAPSPPVVAVPVETPRILGTIIQMRGNPHLRYLDDKRLRRQRRQKLKLGLVVKRTINVKQFAYNLNKEFNSKLPRVNRSVNDFIKTLNVNKAVPAKSGKEPSEVLIKINMIAPKLKTVRSVPIILKEPIARTRKKKKGFDFDKFLEYTPNMKSKHRFLQ